MKDVPDDLPEGIPSSCFPPKEIWILGAGRFGVLATERLKRRLPEARFLLVDHREEKLAEVAEVHGIAVRKEDAIEFLSRSELPPDLWIIPAVPVHVAYQWVIRRLARDFAVEPLPVPTEVEEQTPNPLRAASGTVYASFATFRCPDYCNEPAFTCTHTGKPRIGILHQRFSALNVPGFEALVVQSIQLAPGVGGYPAAILQALYEHIAGCPGKYLVSTGCKCHGVVDALVTTPLPVRSHA